MDILDRIDPYLTSQDAPAREFALYAIRSFPAFKAEWPKRLIQAALEDQDNTSSYLNPVEKMELGEEELLLLLEALHTAKLKYPHLFFTVLRNLPLSVKIANREQIGTLFPPEEWEFLLKLNDAANKDELDAMLQEIVEDLEANEYDHLLYSRAKQIAQRQVALGFEDPAELRQLITGVPEDQWFNYKELIAVYKLGLLKDSGSISELASLFSRDEDFLQEEVADALATFQSDDVVRAVESYARSKDPIFPINVIAQTHSQLAVATLKQLYADSDNQSFIIQGLAEQLAPDGRPEIEDFISQKFLPAILNNEELAYGYFKVMEFDHPQLERWGQSAREQYERALKARDEPFDVTLKRFLSSASSKTQAVSDKVGRNDPCPCGSGKKYKKCHGK